MVEQQLDELTLKICRLCLKQDIFIVDIFHQDVEDSSLTVQLFELYQIKVENNGLFPSYICHRCLYMTKAFMGFRENVKKCDAKLQESCVILKKNDSGVSSQQPTIICPNDINLSHTNNQSEGLNGFPSFKPDDDCIITIVDPNQEYESSDDEFSLESETDFPEISENNCEKGENIQNAFNTEIHKQKDISPLELNSKFSAVGSVAADSTNECKNTFHCQYCDMAFTTQIECAEHESRHDAANPFICNFCPFRSTSRQILIYHIREAHDNERPYVCSLCNKGFCRRSDLKKHTIVHTGVRPFTCSVCGKSFSRNTNLTKHMRIHSGVKPHVCQKCPRSFTTATELLQHQRIHAENKPHKCTKCPASFIRKDKLLLHEQSHIKNQSEIVLNQSKHPEETGAAISINQMENIVLPMNPYSDINQEDRPYLHNENTVSIISRTSGSQRHFDYSPGPYILSPPNNKTSILAMQLQRNRTSQTSVEKVKAVRNNRVIGCDMCSKTFTRERDLHRHQALHLDKLFTCKHCGRQFHRREKLYRHEQEHHSQTFKCDVCSNTFSKKDALEIHIKAHKKQNAIFSKQITESEQELQLVRPVSNVQFYDHMLPTMGLGFYSETRPEERHD